MCEYVREGDDDTRWLTDLLFYGDGEYQMEYEVENLIVMPQWLHLQPYKNNKELGHFDNEFQNLGVPFRPEDIY